MVKLGRIGIYLEVFLMSSHIALPRFGHLRHLLRIFGYLKVNHNAEVVFDLSDPVIDESSYKLKD